MLVSPFSAPRAVPPKGHPRLLLNPGRMEAVRKNYTNPRISLAASLFDELLGIEVNGIGATPEFGSYDLGQYLAIEAHALRSLLDHDSARARTAIDGLFVLMDAFGVTGGQLGGRGNMNARWGGHLIFVASEVYDWCYDALTDAERGRIIEACEKIAEATFEMGYPPERQAAISGHGSEAQLLRDLLAFSVAVYDERPDIYNWCAGRLFDEYVPQYRDYLASGAHPQGPSYGSYRWTSLCWAELIFRALGISVFEGIERTGEWMRYMTRPDGEALRLGDDFYETKDEDTRKHPFAVPLFLAWALTGREDFREEAYAGLGREYLLPSHRGMDYYIGGSWGEGLISPTAVLLFDSLTAPKPGVTDESCRYFGFPIGMTVFKRGELQVMMKIGELWNANHDHLDTGSFQIYSGAPLITESGVYDSYGTTHRRHYLIRTCAHSCLTVSRPDRETFGDWKPDAPYDGGTRRPLAGCEPRDMESWARDYRMARVLSHGERQDGCTLEGDLSEAYVHTCTRVNRRFDLTADADGKTAKLTVTDTVDARENDYQKRFLVQCQTEPTVNGRTAVIENGAGRVEIRVLSPEDAVITAVGGAGRQFENDGTNYPPTEPFHAELGWGRLEISPAQARIHDVFRVEFSVSRKDAEEKK